MKKNYESPLQLALIAGVGMFLSTLDSGIINIAIPTLLTYFHTSISIVIWTITLYTLVLSASILIFGRLADQWGRLKLYALGLALFAFSSLLCGSSMTIGWLIFFRAFQGLSAAMMQATAIALITTRLKEHSIAKAMAILGMLLGLGPMMGPVVGGFILSSIGWRWIFWLNIPICFLGLMGCKKLTPIKEELHKKPINYFNLSLLVLSMFLLLLTMNFAHHLRSEFYIFAILTVILIGLYLWAEKRAEHPIIPLTLFKSLNFTAPMLGIIAFGGGTAIAFILPPLYLQKLRYFEAWQVGLISLSAPLGLVVASRISALLVQSLGTLLPILIGISLMTLALLGLTQIQLDWKIYWLFLLLLFYGLGGGLFQTPCYIHLTKQFPMNRQAFISALTRMIQNLSIAFEAAGAALFISIKNTKLPDALLCGIQYGFWLATSIGIIAFIFLLITFIQYRQPHVT